MIAVNPYGIPTGDMFAGYGGFSTGAMRTGKIDLRYAWNHDEHAIDWHRKAHDHLPPERHVRQGCEEIDWSTVAPELEGGLILAAPACQGFSTCGQPARQGTGGNGKVNISELMVAHQGKRNTAYAVIRAAELARPRAIIVENVTKFMQWDAFEWWLDGLRIWGYHVRVHTLNASRYGNAQDRERMIVTACQDGPIDLASDWGAGLDGGTRLRDCLDMDGDGHRWSQIDDKPERTRNLIRSKQEQYGAATGLLNNVGDGVALRSFDDLSPTLTTKSGSQLMHVDHDRVRIINPNELARIMGWRDTDGMPLPRNRELASRLIGNAIPVDLAQGVVEQTVAALS